MLLPRLDGGMSKDAQQAQIALFRGDSSHSVFLVSLRAGGTGLNLPSASVVVLVGHACKGHSAKVP